MPRQQGYYSLVQYCPDPARAEVANVGVLLFSPGHQFIDVRLSTNLRHVKAVFRGLDLDDGQIKMSKQALRERVTHQKDDFQCVDDLKRFVDLRFNQVLLTPPRSIVVEDPERQLRDLFAELVEVEKEQQRASESAQVHQLFPTVDAFFRSPRFHGSVDFDQKVDVPHCSRQLDIPYVFTNGRVFNVKPFLFKTLDPVFRFASEGKLLASAPSEDGKEQELCILPKVTPGPKGEALAREIVGVLREFRQDGVAVVEEGEIPGFLDGLATKVAG